MGLVPQLKVALITFGIALIPYGTAWLLVSLLQSQTINDMWIKPGEQFEVCHDRPFTVSPGKEGVFGFMVYGREKAKRITNELVDGTFTDTKMHKVTRFRAQARDLIAINVTTSSYSVVEVVYYTETTIPGKSILEYIIEPRGEDSDRDNNGDKNRDENKKGGNDNPISTKRLPKFLFKRSSPKKKTIRHVTLSMSGTGHFSESGIFSQYIEYQVEINGTSIGAPYQINITLERKLYNVSDSVTYFYKGTKTLMDDMRRLEICTAVEMAYNGPTTDPLNSETNLGLDSKVRYTIGDVIIVGFLSSFFLIAIVFVLKSMLAQIGIFRDEGYYMINGLFEMHMLKHIYLFCNKEDKDAIKTGIELAKKVIDI